jgi:hypothetical protein
MVPGSPTSLVGCRYHGFNQTAPNGSLAASATLPTQEIAAALNGVPIPAPDAPLPNCPADFGEVYVLWFGYASGPPLLVSVQGAGCFYADNGDLRVPFASAAATQLSPLLGHDDR